MNAPPNPTAAHGQYFALLRASLDAVLLTNARGGILAANAAACAMFRCSEQDLIRNGRERYVDRSDPRVADAIAQRDRTGFARREFTFIRHDGERFPGDVASVTFRDEQGDLLSSVAIRDISERVRHESRLHELAERLQRIREEEGMRIARVVHDEVGQQLTALKMDLRWIETRVEKLGSSAPPGLVDKVVAATTVLDDMVRTVQGIGAELRPPILDKLGLFAALRHETQQFGQRAGLACQLFTPDPPPVLAPELATACYRIVQEALTNVARHAAAGLVEVEFRTEAGGHVVEIRDDGRGFPPERLMSGQSLGVLGMQERARALGGEVAVEARPLRGTVVRAKFPAHGRRTA